MISVCMATYNGEKYLREQIDSILCQLKEEDELIISDDHSKDKTVEIIKSYNDKRIKFFYNDGKNGVIHNFENALKRANGDIIFLSDQDDVWLPNKVTVFLQYFQQYDTIISDCFIVDSNLNDTGKSMYGVKQPKNGIINNIIQNHYLGCCMAFKRNVLNRALPFPPKIAMHDIWLGLCGECVGKVGFIEEKLTKYRRHEATVTSIDKSPLKVSYRISYRIYFARELFKRFALKR